MKAAIHHATGRHFNAHAQAMCDGLRRHGVEVVSFSDIPDASCDFAVGWSWRVGSRLRKEGYAKPFLVMERGYIGDRMQWTSLGWDGLNGRARFPAAQDRGERFWHNFEHLACEWEQVDGYYLVMGQVIGDMALTMVDFQRWVEDTVEALERLRLDVRFRPHPEAVKRGQVFNVPSYMVLGGTMADALAEAACVVTWNSNSGVDAVLAGVPVVTTDEGAMAWPVTSHSPFEPLVTPDRNEWFRDMAWKQFTLPEIQSGFAWEIVRQAMPK